MRYLNLALAILFAGMPFVTPFNGFAPTLYPVPQNDPAMLPIGWAFSIWGVIYLGLIIHTAYGVIRADRPVSISLSISLAIGVIWLPIAGVSPVWATILILIMLGAALHAMLAGRAAHDPWRVDLPLGLYAGWLSAASVVSVAMLAAGYGLLFDDLGWARILIPAAALFTCAVQWRLGTAPGYSLAVIWGLFGIAIRAKDQHIDVVALSTVAAIAVAGVLLATYRRKIH